MAAQLRVYSESLDTDMLERQEPSINIPLGDLLPLLVFARRNNYLWLKDFLADEITITADLYDVLRSFSEARRPSA